MQTPKAPRPPPSRPVTAAVIGGGVCLFAVVAGITVLGWHSQGVNEVATTGLASIGATLAGGFAGWIARGRYEGEDDERKTDGPG
jgi:hypothetical protein